MCLSYKNIPVISYDVNSVRLAFVCECVYTHIDMTNIYINKYIYIYIYTTRADKIYFLRSIQTNPKALHYILTFIFSSAIRSS